MIELTFNSGTAGTLVHATEPDDNSSPDKISLEVIKSLSLFLDIGDISKVGKDINSRDDIIKLLYGKYGEGVVNGILEFNCKTISKLKEAKDTGEKIRVWVHENSPADICGLYFISDMFHGCKSEISVAMIPNTLELTEGVVWYHCMDEVPGEKYFEFAKNEKVLTPKEREFHRGAWKELVKANAPLRIVINGKVAGVSEDFYDSFIRTKIPKGEFVSAKLIGQTMITIPAINDRLLYLRITKMIENGELEEISPPALDHPYSAILKKRN